MWQQCSLDYTHTRLYISYMFGSQIKAYKKSIMLSLQQKTCRCKSFIGRPHCYVTYKNFTSTFFISLFFSFFCVLVVQMKIRKALLSHTVSMCFLLKYKSSKYELPGYKNFAIAQTNNNNSNIKKKFIHLTQIIHTQQSHFYQAKKYISSPCITHSLQ